MNELHCHTVWVHSMNFLLFPWISLPSGGFFWCSSLLLFLSWCLFKTRSGYFRDAPITDPPGVAQLFSYKLERNLGGTVFQAFDQSQHALDTPFFFYPVGISSEFTHMLSMLLTRQHILMKHNSWTCVDLALRPVEQSLVIFTTELLFTFLFKTAILTGVDIWERPEFQCKICFDPVVCFSDRLFWHELDSATVARFKLSAVHTHTPTFCFNVHASHMFSNHTTYVITMTEPQRLVSCER